MSEMFRFETLIAPSYSRHHIYLQLF